MQGQGRQTPREGKGQMCGQKTRLKGKRGLSKNFLGQQNRLHLPADDIREEITLNTYTAFVSPIKKMIFFPVYVVYAYMVLA